MFWKKQVYIQRFLLTREPYIVTSLVDITTMTAVKPIVRLAVVRPTSTVP